MSTRIQGVIFDFGNVLGGFDKMKACRRLACSSNLSAEAIRELVTDHLEKRLESGAMSETAFANELLHLIGSRLTVPDVMRIWGNIFHANPDIIPHVHWLQESGVRIGVLSNTNSIHWPYAMDLPVMQMLSRNGASFSLSHELGDMKPSPHVFRAALERMGTDPAHTLYIDDIKAYVDAARGLGMCAERYSCGEHSSQRLSDIFRRFAV